MRGIYILPCNALSFVVLWFKGHNSITLNPYVNFFSNNVWSNVLFTCPINMIFSMTTTLSISFLNHVLKALKLDDTLKGYNACDVWLGNVIISNPN